LFQPPESPFLVPFDRSFRVARAPTAPPGRAPGKKKCQERLARLVAELDELQSALFADDRHAVLLVFQALDAAGKDGTIRAVTTGINPAAFQVSSFGRPSKAELDHDFLWRTGQPLPERGRIGIFNRSYYEEVLVVRVHPELLEAQRLPWRPAGDALWLERCESIREHERHLARNGTVVLKFWLNVSRAEQARRLHARLEDRDKHWKFEGQDIDERRRWDDYMTAFETALNETSRPWAPWYAIPADHKPFMRASVAEIFRDALRGLELVRPGLDAQEQAMRKRVLDQLAREARAVRPRRRKG
jgi:PPK2 family polyphosphate:nucleotide phosphotransferase